MCYLLVLLAECMTEPSGFLARFVASAELYRVAQREWHKIVVKLNCSTDFNETLEVI
jgi:hypothetical protein